MKCPKCGAEVGGMNMVVGFVRIETHRCKNCGKAWRQKFLIVPFCIHALSNEIERLHVKHPGKKPHHVQLALDYLQSKVDSHARSALDRDSALRKRRNDLWERRFLRDALEEVF